MTRIESLIAAAAALVYAFAPLFAHAIGDPQYVFNRPAAGAFALVDHAFAAPLIVSDSDWPQSSRAPGKFPRS